MPQEEGEQEIIHEAVEHEAGLDGVLEEVAPELDALTQKGAVPAELVLRTSPVRIPVVLLYVLRVRVEQNDKNREKYLEDDVVHGDGNHDKRQYLVLAKISAKIIVKRIKFTKTFTSTSLEVSFLRIRADMMLPMEPKRAITHMKP